MVQGKWIRPPSKKGRFGASVVFYPLAFSNLFRIASNRSSPTPRTFWKGSSMGMTARLSGWRSFTTRSKKATLFSSSLYPFKIYTSKHTLSLHDALPIFQGITGKGPLTFLETGIRSILEFADNGLTTIGKSLVLGPMQEVAI